MSKRPSPMPAGPAKRAREDDSAPQNNNGGGQSMDPDQLSDALLSAGVDLREEENLLSSSVHGAHVAGAPGSAPAPMDLNTMFLDIPRLHGKVERLAQEEGIRYALDYERPELAGLVSAACAEWLAEIVTQASMISRHRRLSKNDGNSQLSKALRNIAQQDREAESRRQNLKLSMGIGSESGSKNDDSEETQQRAANETARMMTSGGKRYNWLSGGSAASRPPPTARSRQNDPTRVREVKEDPGIVLRDLLAALEEKHMGVRKALIKGYSRTRD